MTPTRYEASGENRLLAALDPQDRARVQRQMRVVDLPRGERLYVPNRPIQAVYFPVTGVLSLLSESNRTMPVEVATVGNEGFVGMPVFLGADSIPGLCLSQVPGQSLRMSSAAFRRVLEQVPALQPILHRYAQALFNQISQSAACNRVHTIEERCARWLVMTHDRVGSDSFSLTQEFLGQMLGVRRAAVNLAAGLMQKAGYIRYQRGIITVTDREGLEAAACECYRIVRDEYDRLLPPRAQDRPRATLTSLR